MIDFRTATLVGGAILSPYLLEHAAAAGIPVPVYVTPGQLAALAVFPATVGGVSSVNGTDSNARLSFASRWQAINDALLSQNGAAQLSSYTNPSWNPTHLAKLTPSQAVDFANALIGAADAGMVNPNNSTQSSALGLDAAFNDATDYYPPSLSDSTEYQDIKGLLSANSTWGSDDGDATDFIEPIHALALKLDDCGYLASGKPFHPTVTGGIGAAADAVKAWGKTALPSALGSVLGVLADVLLSTPGLMLVGGVLVYAVVKKRVIA